MGTKPASTRALPLLLLSLAAAAGVALAASSAGANSTEVAAAATGCSGVCGISIRQGGTARPTCLHGLVVTGIPAAIYGAAGKGCVSRMSHRVAWRRCVGRPFCTIPATNEQFGGDPCPRVATKSLWVRYRCGPSPTKQPSSLRAATPGEEGTRASASCPSGQVITSIANPFYGRMRLGCNATSSYRVVAAECLSKASCSVRASNKVFGYNPCKGVLKALFWEFSCGTAPRQPPTPAPAGGSGYSALWGRSGELWKATGPVVDHSYAGYMANERGIPSYPTRFNVQQYGAAGDGEADDTAAFLAAIKAAEKFASGLSRAPDRGFQNEGREGVAVLVPPGKYKLTRTIEITSSNMVLQGAGPGRTTLYFPKPLAAIYGNQQKWALGGTFLTIVGNNPGMNHERSRLTPLTAAARRGDCRLQVASTGDIQVGSWICIYALDRYHGPSKRARQLLADDAAAAAPGNSNHSSTSTTAAGPVSSDLAQPPPLPLTPGLRRAAAQARLDLAVEEAEEQQGVFTAAAQGSLDAYLYGEQAGAPSGQNMYDKADHIRFTSRVKAKGQSWLELERPLNYDLRLHWKPYIYSFNPEVQHSGFEGFTVLFANGPYPEHHTAYGYNAIGIDEGANCWVRDVKIVNADNGIIVQRSDFVTVRDVDISVQRPRWTPDTEPYNGHHGIWAAGTTNSLFTRFYVADRYWHDITLAIFAENTVFSNGGGLDMNIDLHRGGPHNNLLSNLNTGLGQRPFMSGGYDGRGSHSAANNTFWNVFAASASQLLALPPCDFGPQQALAGGAYGPPGDGSSDSGGGDRRRLMAADGRAAVAWCVGQGWWVELAARGSKMQPADLHDAMVARRLGQR
ncbi:hypothetical protein ABPG75_013751 [Micractinium tetrahymenae]